MRTPGEGADEALLSEIRTAAGEEFAAVLRDLIQNRGESKGGARRILLAFRRYLSALRRSGFKFRGSNEAGEPTFCHLDLPNHKVVLALGETGDVEWVLFSPIENVSGIGMRALNKLLREHYLRAFSYRRGRRVIHLGPPEGDG